MKLYTINATPESINNSKEDNARLHKHYSREVSRILSASGIDGFTIEKVKGYWQGTPEVSYKIGIATDNDKVLTDICEVLRDDYKQDAVMLTYPDNTVIFI